MKYYVWILILCSGSALFAQQTNRHSLTVKPIATAVDLSQPGHDFSPILAPREMPAPGDGSYRSWLVQLKDSLYNDYQPAGRVASTDGEVAPPKVLAGFEGNLSGFSVPNDNDVAISVDGAIVSVINSNLHVYNTEGTLLSDVSLGEIADTLGSAQSSFDPRLRYDPNNDRFVLVFLDGFEPDSSFVIVAFSQTSDPAGAWNVYELPGNPKDNNTWTDYPMFALTEDELFLTINLLIPDEPWQTGFSETIIWQMSLENGYNGDPLDAVFWDGVDYGGAPLRNLNPVQGGEGPAGPDMYFLSNRNFSESNDSIFIVRVTGTFDDPGTTLEIGMAKADIPYGVPPFARQENDHTFDTNDGRILGSFIQNNSIQFVSNTLDPATGFCGVYHGIISDLEGEPVVTADIIGDDTLDLGYPDISYTGRYDDDIQCIITCDHTAPEVYAGMSAFFYNYGGYSERVGLITGDTWVNMLSGTYERWGDYTGSQPMYGSPGVVWVSGNFGKRIDIGPFYDRKNATWIASLRSNDSLPPVAVESLTYGNDPTLYPLPAREWMQADIYLESASPVSFFLTDMQGRMMFYLVESRGSTGRNTFTFDTSSLPVGQYLLVAEQQGRRILAEPFVKQ